MVGHATEPLWFKERVQINNFEHFDRIWLSITFFREVSEFARVLDRNKNLVIFTKNSFR